MTWVFTLGVALASSIMVILLFFGGCVGVQASVISWKGMYFVCILAFLLSLGDILYLLISPSIYCCIHTNLLFAGIFLHLPSFCWSSPFSWDITLHAALQVFHIFPVGCLMLGHFNVDHEGFGPSPSQASSIFVPSGLDISTIVSTLRYSLTLLMLSTFLRFVLDARMWSMMNESLALKPFGPSFVCSVASQHCGHHTCCLYSEGGHLVKASSHISMTSLAATQPNPPSLLRPPSHTMVFTS